MEASPGEEEGRPEGGLVEESLGVGLLAESRERREIQLDGLRDVERRVCTDVKKGGKDHMGGKM